MSDLVLLAVAVAAVAGLVGTLLWMRAYLDRDCVVTMQFVDNNGGSLSSTVTMRRSIAKRLGLQPVETSDEPAYETGDE